MITVSHLTKTFNKNSLKEVKAVRDVSLTFPDRGLIVITGASGSGKSTFLNLLGLIEKFDSGSITIKSNNLTRFKMQEFDRLRNHLIGHIYQNYHLDPELTVYENLELKLTLSGRIDKKENERIINYALELVGMKKYTKRLASHLSGGQKQRVGIARALIFEPEVILADEPTGNLDVANTFKVMELLKEISKEKLVLLVTHEVNMALSFADRIITFEDGAVKSDEDNTVSSSFNFQDNQQINVNGLEHNHSQISNLEVDCFTDNSVLPTTLTIVIKNNKIYLETKSDIEPVLVTPKSGLEIINESVEQKTISAFDVSLDKLNYMGKTTTKTTNPLPSRKVFAECLKRVFISKKFFGKLFLFIVLFFGFLLTFLVSRLTANIESFKPDNRFNSHTVFAYKKGLSSYRQEDVIDALAKDNINRFFYLTNLTEDTQFYEFFLLNKQQNNTATYGFNAHLELNGDKRVNIVAGTNDLTGNNCLVSTAFITDIIKSTTSQDYIYFQKYQDFIGQELGRSNISNFATDKLKFRISGVFSSSVNKVIISNPETLELATSVTLTRQPNITNVITPEIYDKFLENTNYHLNYYDLDGNKTSLTPSDINKTDNIYIPLFYKENIYNFKQISQVFQNLTVNGFYTIVDNENKVVDLDITKALVITGKKNRDKLIISDFLNKSTEERITVKSRPRSNLSIEQNNDYGLIFELKDIKKGTSELKDIFGKGLVVVDANRYFNQINYASVIKNSLPSIIVIIVIVIVCVMSIYFLVRTSVIIRKKDIIMLRLIGVSRFYIIKEFIFEILLYYFFFYAVGVIGGIGVIAQGTNYTTLLKNVLVLDPLVLLGAHLLIFGLFLVFGTLPILLLTRKTPANLQTASEL